MNNSQSLWRTRARIVAYIDFVLLCINLIGVLLIVLFFTGTIGAVAAAQNDHIKISHSSSSGSWSGSADERKIQFHDDYDAAKAHKTAVTFALVILWVILAIAVVLTGIQMWAAVKLINATEIGTDANVAVGNARIYRNVSIVFFVFAVLSCFTAPHWPYVLSAIWRGGFIFIAYQYIKELEGLIGGYTAYP